MSQSLEEVLSRLNVQGASTLGGSSFANFLPVLNSSGQLDPSLFTSTTNFYQVTTGGGGLGGISSPTPGTIAVLDNTAAYVRLASSWLLISELAASGISFTPASGLVSTNTQAAIAELATKALSTTTDASITGNITFDTGGAPFIIGSSSTNILVPGLNAQLLNGNPSSFFTSATNITSGTLPVGQLAGTYNISINGYAQNAYLANTASALDVSRLNNSTSGTYISSSLLSGSYSISVTGNAATASTAALFNGNNPAYYLNPANLTGGIIPSSIFNDTSHGSRSGGTLHALAIPTGSGGATSGFISADDQAKLNTVTSGAEPNQNAYSYISLGVATAIATVTGNAVSAITVLSSSIGYTSAPSVAISGGGGTGATATCTIDSFGAVNGFTITNGGSGYTSVPTVVIGSGYGSLPASNPSSTLILLSGSNLLSVTPNSTNKSITLGINLSGLQHNSLGGLTVGDPHTQYLILNGGSRGSQTISGSIVFNPGSIAAPFTIGSNATGQLVTGLNAQLLNGNASSFFTNASNLGSGYISNARILPGDTYPISITGTASGGLSLTSGGTITGPVSVEGLTDTNLAGGGTLLVGVNNSGTFITSGLTTALLPEGGGNNYFTFANLYTALQSILQPSAGSTLTWNITNGTTAVPSLSLTTSNVSEGGNLYFTSDRVLSVITSNESAILNDLTGVTTASTSATNNSLAIRDSSAGLTAGNYYLPGSGSMVFGSASALPGLITTSTTPTSGQTTALATVGYVNSTTASFGDIAEYDLPIYHNGFSSVPVQDIEAGILSYEQSTDGLLHIVNAFSSYRSETDIALTYDVNNPLTTYTNSNTTAAGGTISPVQYGHLLKASNLVSSATKAAAQVFCPAIRLSEPYTSDNVFGGVAGATTYTNPNFRLISRNAVQVRGQAGTNYALLFRLQGFISLRHNWNLVYYTVASGVYTKHTYNINAAITTWAGTTPPHPLPGDIWQYVDTDYAILIAGKSSLKLECELRDGKLTPTFNCSFAGIPPYASSIPGTSKPPFNGGFVNINPTAVWSAGVNAPFSPFIPDSLFVQSDGEILVGGINYFPVDSTQDTRQYDGEDIIDNQGNPIGLTNAGGIFPTYSTSNTGVVPNDFDKTCVRCDVPAVNKYHGVNGFLRRNPAIYSGIGLSAPLAANQTALALLPIATVNTMLAVPLPTTDFTLLGKTVAMTGVTTMGGLITAVNAVTGSCTVSGVTSTISWFTLSYDGVHDRFKLQLNCSTDNNTTNPIIFDDTSPLMQSLRLVFGPDSGTLGSNIADRSYAYSIPQASGVYIASNGSTVLGSFYTSIPITIYNGTTGSFSVDNNTITYTLTTSFAQLQTSFAALGYTLLYNGLSNEFGLERIAGFFNDTLSLTPPRIYDINGNLMSSLGLAKESHGNADFPSQSIHKMVQLLNGVAAVGDFRNYSGATSPGMAVINLDGKINYQFKPGIGFNSPVYALSNASDSTTDIFVGALDSSSFQGFNKKDIYRINVQGNEAVTSGVTTTSVLESPVSQDAQTRVLGIVTASNGDFIVLTPRKIVAYTAAGVIKTNSTYSLPSIYVGSPSFQGITKWQDVGSLTYFIVASTVYSTSIELQSYTDLADISYIAPSGLRLFRYNQSTGDITLDPTWVQTTGAGVGAAASCAYPIIAGPSNNPYVICGNRAGWWNSGITDETNADWSWNITKKGNLLFESENLADSTYWTTNGSITVTTTPGSGGSLSTNVVTATSSGNNGNSYIQQIMNLSGTFAATYQPTTTQNHNNPGGVLYEFDTELELQSSPTAYAAIQLRFDANSASNTSWQYSISVIVNLSNTALGNSRITGYAPLPSLPDNATLADVIFEVYDKNVGLSNATTVIRMVSQDTSSYNNNITCRVYPAFIPSTSSPGSFSSSPATGAVTVTKTALRYYSAWGAWGASNGTDFSSVYVETGNAGAGGYTLPTVTGGSGSTNSGDFEGLYKISLAAATEGQAYYDIGGRFSVSPLIFSENQSHAIPFGVDSAENIYIGGPISGFVVSDTTVNVTPWRIYKLNKYGSYLPADPFNINTNFNDRVTSCIITDSNYVIVAGTFSCYNNTAANKLIFLDTLGNPVNNIDPSQLEVIVQASAPTNPALFDKLWLDTSGTLQTTNPEPPILKVYDPSLVDGVPLGWTNVVFSNRKLPDPALVISPDNTHTTDPTGVSIAVGAAFTQINNADNGTNTNTNAVILLANYTLNGATPSFLDSNGTNIVATGGNYFTVGETVTLPINVGSTAETITVYAQTIPSQAMSNAAFATPETTTTVVTDGTTTTTTTTVINADGAYIFPSEVISQTFIINPASSTPIISDNGTPITTTSVFTHTINTSSIANLTVGTVAGEVFYYTQVPLGITPQPYSTANVTNGIWFTYSGSIPVGSSCDTYFIGVTSGKAPSGLVGPITVNFTPTIPTPGNQIIDITTPGNNTVSINGSGTGILFSFGSAGIVPSITNFDNISVFYKPYISGVVTFNILDLLTNLNYTSLPVYDSATGQIVINTNSVTVSGNPNPVTAANIVDQSYTSGTTGIYQLVVNLTPAVEITSDSTLDVIDNHTLTENNLTHGSVIGATPDQYQLYIAPVNSGSVLTGSTLVYNLVAYSGGVGVGSPSPGTFSSTVPYVSGWNINLEKSLTGTSGAGTITSTTSSPTVSGVSTTFSSTLAAGDLIFSGGTYIGMVLTVGSNTSLTLTTNGNAAVSTAAWTHISSSGAVANTNYIIYNYANFDVIYYTYSSNAGTYSGLSHIYPSIDFFETVFNNSSATTVSGSLVNFVWTASPPVITVNYDVTYGAKSFTATATHGGTLYYTLDSTVNLLTNPSGNGIFINSGNTIFIDGSGTAPNPTNVEGFVYVNSGGLPQLKISLVEVISGSIAIASKNILQTVASIPYTKVVSYQIVNQTPTLQIALTEWTAASQPANNVDYGAPSQSIPLMAVTDTTPNLSAKVIWGETSDFPTMWGDTALPVGVVTPPTNATELNLPASGALAFTPTSTTGEITIGVRLYTPTTLPSRTVNYQIAFALPPIKFGGLTTVTTAPSPATSGTSIVVADYTQLPVGTGFTCLVYPDNGTAGNGINRPVSPEVFTVTARSGNTLTITRGSPARTIVVGDLITIFNARNYQVTLTSVLETADIRYTLDGSAATETSVLYQAGTPIDINADMQINAIAVPASTGIGSTGFSNSANQAVNYITSPNFNNDLALGLINIAFGDCENELSRSDITLQNPVGVTTVNCPIGNSVLNNNLFPQGLGFNISGAANENAYWNVVNIFGFPSFVPLRNAKGSHNVNNQVQARIYYNTEQFDLSALQASSGTGTNSHILLKGICVAGLLDNPATLPGTLVEIENLPSGKYVIMAMNMSQFLAGATTVGTNTVTTELDIVNISNSGVILSNISTPNPAFYFNGPNPYGDLRYYIDGTREASRRTGIVGQWQAAIIAPNPATPAASISFAITGTNLICLQIIPVVEILQPQVATSGSGIAIKKMIYNNLAAGNYDLMYVHGSVKIPETPGFSGEGYFMTYVSSPGNLTTIAINDRELFRYTQGAQSSQYYSGSTTQFTHYGGDLQLEYFNSSITNGDYSNNLVISDTTNFPYLASSHYPYIAHGLSYVTTDPNGWEGNGGSFQLADPVVAPVFALINHDNIEDVDLIEGNTTASATATISGGAVTGITGLTGGSGYIVPPNVYFSGGDGNGVSATAVINTSGVVTGITNLIGGTGYTVAPTVYFYSGEYCHPPIFIPSLRTTFDMDAFDNQVELYSYQSTTTSDVDILYTTDGTVPVAGAGNTTVYSSPITYTPGMIITAAAHNTSLPAIYSPVTTIEYPSGTSLTSINNSITITGFNFRAEKSTDATTVAHLASKTYPYVYDQSSITRIGGITNSATPNSIGWLSNNVSTSSSAAIAGTTELGVPGITDVSYTGHYYQFSILADFSHDITLASVSSLYVFSQPQPFGIQSQVLQSQIYVTPSQWSSIYSPNGWTVFDTTSTPGLYGIQYFARTSQPITAGGNMVDFQYSTTPDFSTYTTISSSNISQAGSEITTVNGSTFQSITGITDISPDINNGLQNVTITIPAGKSAYFRLIPYQAIASNYDFGLVNNNALSVEDFKVNAYITSAATSFTTSTVSSALSNVAVTTNYNIPVTYNSGDATTHTEIDVTVKEYSTNGSGGTLAGSGVAVILTIDSYDGTNFDTLSASSSFTSPSTSGSLTVNTTSGVSKFYLHAGSGSPSHIVRATAAVGSVALDASASVRIGSTTSDINLNRSGVPSTTLVANNSDSITATITLNDVVGNPLVGATVTYAGIISGSIYTGSGSPQLNSLVTATTAASPSQTDTSGMIIFTIQGIKAGTAILEFNVTGESPINTGSITLTAGVMDSSKCSYTCSPLSQVSNLTLPNSDNIVGTVVLFDTYYNPIAGYNILPNASSGPAGLIYTDTSGNQIPSVTPFLVTNSSGTATLWIYGSSTGGSGGDYSAGSFNVACSSPDNSDTATLSTNNDIVFT